MSPTNFFGPPEPPAEYRQVVLPSPPIRKNQIGTSKKVLQQYKQQLQISKTQLESGVGLLLGDASLQTQDQGNSYRLKFELTSKNSDYLNHIKNEVFSDYIIAEPNEIIRVNKNNNEVKTLQLQTISHKDFSQFAEIFLNSEGKKCIKKHALKSVLSPRSLAYWFMDDGGKMDYGPNQGKGLVFNTHCFTLAEVTDLCNVLKENFDFKTWPKKNKGAYIVAISGKDFEKFLDLVDPYIIPSMRYKLPSKRKS